MIGFAAMIMSSCNNWLTVYPENEQVTDNFWTSKEEVEAVLNSGYYYLREAVPNILNWGELRAGSVYSKSSNALQSFQVLATNKEFSNWGPLYQVINMANLILKNTDGVLAVDNTLAEAQANSFKTEAYFLRALSYFYIVRIWQNAPLILEPYEKDEASYNIPCSTEEELIRQIKNDLITAIESGAAKEAFEEVENTKGRATIWALYALYADVCLWSGDYQTTVTACDAILNSTSNQAPVFMRGLTEETQWFKLFNPGNSNESIFEVQYSYSENKDNQNKLWSSYFSADPQYLLSAKMHENLTDDISEAYDASGALEKAVRSFGTGMYATASSATSYMSSNYCWKYAMGDVGAGSSRGANSYPNFIIYRVAEIKLIKAEAETMLGNFNPAIEEINDIRTRGGLAELDAAFVAGASEETLLTEILSQRNIEFLAEGKRWFDLLRYGRCNNNKYYNQFVSIITDYNSTANPSWIRSVLNDKNACYMPIWATEIDNNPALTQNPYYE